MPLLSTLRRLLHAPLILLAFASVHAQPLPAASNQPAPDNPQRELPF